MEFFFLPPFRSRTGRVCTNPPTSPFLSFPLWMNLPLSSAVCAERSCESQIQSMSAQRNPIEQPQGNRWWKVDKWAFCHLQRQLDEQVFSTGLPATSTSWTPGMTWRVTRRWRTKGCFLRSRTLWVHLDSTDWIDFCASWLSENFRFILLPVE